LDEKKSNRTSFDDSDIVQIFSEIKDQELKDMMKRQQDAQKRIGKPGLEKLAAGDHEFFIA
jgi:hypothetical protein